MAAMFGDAGAGLLLGTESFRSLASPPHAGPETPSCRHSKPIARSSERISAAWWCLVVLGVPAPTYRCGHTEARLSQQSQSETHTHAYRHGGLLPNGRGLWQRAKGNGQSPSSADPPVRRLGRRVKPLLAWGFHNPHAHLRSSTSAFTSSLFPRS